MTAEVAAGGGVSVRLESPRRSGRSDRCLPRSPGRRALAGALAVAAALILIAPVRAQTPTGSAIIGSPADPASTAVPMPADPQARAEAILAGVRGEWSVAAWSIDRSRRLISIGADRALIPASNNKVFTSIWALDVLGADHRFETDLLIDGPIEGGVLRGDVVLRGSGDPAFGYPPRTGQAMFVEDPMTPLRRMATRLRDLGVHAVEGGVIADASAFDGQRTGPNWPSDTGGGVAQYAPGVSGLAYQRNMIWIEVAGTSGASEATIRLEPAVSVVPVLASVRVGSGRTVATRRAADDTVRVTGSIPGGSSIRYGVGVADPALMAGDALRTALLEAGISVAAPTRVATTPAGAHVVHRHFSIPLSLMIPLLNRNSDNFFAEQIWMATVREVVGTGSYVRGGSASALHFMDRMRVPAGEVYQFDGSGLSNLNRASANALVRALVYAHSRGYSDAFHGSMAIAGDPSGSMSGMFRGTTAAGNLHGKTGFINRARTISGYVRARNGELIAFSILYNGPDTNGARVAQEALGVLLAEYDGG